MWRPSILILAVVLSSVYSAPQELISFKDGKIGVNFGGYHAGVGIGGILGGNGGAGGGLFAEAGTPHGQAARAGLGGAVDGSGQNAGGLYAGATAGGNVRAHAGLAGGVSGGKSEGVGFATAQAGDRVAHSGLGGEASAEGSHGYKFAGTETGVEVGVEKTEFIQPVELPTAKVHKKVHKEFKFETENELKPVQPAASSGVEAEAGINIKTNVQPINLHPAPVVVKEVSRDWTPRWNNDYRHAFDFHGFFSSLYRNPVEYQQPWIGRKMARLYKVFVEPPPVFVEKRIRYKPRHHHRKHAYFGGYIGADAAPPAPVVYKTVEVSRPVIQKRIDVQTYAGHDVAADASAQAGGTADIGYRKQVTFQRNPTFFADIFNIPIQTLKAVGGFLSNSAGSTSVSVQKTATINAEPELISSKHAPSVSSSSGGEISIQTPTASKFIDDIFAIPINTLGAVNKFLENNVQRKQVIQEGESQVHVRSGPHARRRANKEVVIVREREAPDNVE